MRHLESVKINGTSYSLLGFTSYDFLPDSGDGSYIYQQSGNQFPYGMTAGYSFSTDANLFPNVTSEGTIHYFDDYPEVYIKKYLYTANTIAFGSFYTNGQALTLIGYLTSSDENLSQNMLGIILDDTRQLGYIIQRCYFAPNRNFTGIVCQGGNNQIGQLIYSVFGVQYNWQSVPSISGKNGILQSLSTLVNINDGNPVSGASASAVNIIPASVVSGMIQTGASDVIVSFEIPQLTSGTYDSIKLVGKRGGIPRSKTDGEFIETLSDSDTSKTLTGLTKGYTYWFVIFAEDSKGSSSESDPYPYETGEGESIAFFEIDLGQGGKDIVRYDASKTIGGHKQGELYGNYSIANDELSTNGYIYWDYDATENPKSIPADCCLYFEYDTLFTGSEGYLDWYVLDANNDQQIYWCYDTKYEFQSNKWYNCLVVAEVKNGYIKRYKYVLDGIEISNATANIKMPCTDAEGSIGISEIYFHTTQPTKIKNMSIYYDFSTYHDNGGGYSGYN